MLTRNKHKKGSFNREVAVFLFFLILSFVFWYLNELSKELRADIHYPVRYINPPKERILTGELPDKLEMELRGPGYSILKMKLSGSKAPVVVDFSKVAPIRLPGKTQEYYLLSSSLIDDFVRQLHADFEIVSVHPDTLVFGYQRIVTRRMPVIANVNVPSSPSNKIVIVTDPDSVTVTGAEHVLDTIKGIRTRFKSFSRTGENFRASLPLIIPDYMETTQKRVAIEVTVLGKPADFFNLKASKTD